MRTDHPVDELLIAWGSWCRRENDTNLGYAQVQYTEYIARASSATGYVDLDPDVPVLDELIRKTLAYAPRRMLELRYVQGLPDKTAGRLLSLTRTEFNKILNMSVLPQLRHSWDCAHKIAVD